METVPTFVVNGVAGGVGGQVAAALLAANGDATGRTAPVVDTVTGRGARVGLMTSVLMCLLSDFVGFGAGIRFGLQSGGLGLDFAEHPITLAS